MLENLYLDGKVVVITGGGTGLGLEMVRALTRSGADLAIAGRRARTHRGSARRGDRRRPGRHRRAHRRIQVSRRRRLDRRNPPSLWPG